MAGYKNNKIMLPIKEFLIVKEQATYELNTIDMSKVTVFYRKYNQEAFLETYQTMPKGDYRINEVSGNKQLEVTNLDVLDKYYSIQLCRVVDLTSSQYNPSGEIDVITLNQHLNEVIADVTFLFSYLKDVGMVMDSSAGNKILAELKPNTTWFMDENGNMAAMPVNSLFEGFNQLVETLRQQVLTLLTQDYSKLSQDLKDETTLLIKSLSDKFDELVTKSKEVLDEYTQEKIQEIKEVCDRLLSLEDKLWKANTIEDLKQMQFLKSGDVVEVLGYYQAGDGAGHKRVIADSDDGSGVQLANGLYANIVHNGEVNVSWFGAKNSETFDSSDFIQKAINCNSVKKLIIPDGYFLCRKTLNLKDYFSMQGTNRGSSKLVFEISDTDYAFVFDKGDNAGVNAYNPTFRDLNVYSQGGFLRIADETSPIKDGQDIPYYMQGLISNCTIVGNSTYTLLCFNKVFDFRIENCEMYAGKGHFSVFRGCDLNSFMNNRLVGGAKTMFVEKRENTFGSQTTYAYNDIMAGFVSPSEEERYFFEWNTNAIQILGNYLEGGSTYCNGFFHQKGYWSYTIKDNRCETSSEPKKYLLTISNDGCLGADVSNNTCSVPNFAYINYKGIKGIKLKTADKWGKFNFTLNEGYNDGEKKFSEEDFPVTLTQNFYSLKFTPNTPYLINSGDSTAAGTAVYYKNMLRVDKGGIIRFGGNEKPIKEKGYFNLVIHTNNINTDGTIFFRTDKMYSETLTLNQIIITKSFLAEDLEVFIVANNLIEGTDLYIKSLELVNCKDTNILYGHISNFTNPDYIPNGCICIGTNTRHIWNGSEWLTLEATTQVESLNTPYHTTRMAEEGGTTLTDFYSYLDEKYAYDKQLQEEEKAKYEAYSLLLQDNPNLTWEEFEAQYSNSSMMNLSLVERIQEPVIPESVVKFMEKYLGTTPKVETKSTPKTFSFDEVDKLNYTLKKL